MNDNNPYAAPQTIDGPVVVREVDDLEVVRMVDNDIRNIGKGLETCFWTSVAGIGIYFFSLSIVAIFGEKEIFIGGILISILLNIAMLGTIIYYSRGLLRCLRYQSLHSYRSTLSVFFQINFATAILGVPSIFIPMLFLVAPLMWYVGAWFVAVFARQFANEISDKRNKRLAEWLMYALVIILVAVICSSQLALIELGIRHAYAVPGTSFEIAQAVIYSTEIIVPFVAIAIYLVILKSLSQKILRGALPKMEEETL